jgi:hypothetical protein
LRVLARASWRLSSIRSLSGTILRRCREDVLQVEPSDEVGRRGRVAAVSARRWGRWAVHTSNSRRVHGQDAHVR